MNGQQSGGRGWRTLYIHKGLQQGLPTCQRHFFAFAKDLMLREVGDKTVAQVLGCVASHRREAVLVEVELVVYSRRSVPNIANEVKQSMTSNGLDCRATLVATGTWFKVRVQYRVGYGRPAITAIFMRRCGLAAMKTLLRLWPLPAALVWALV